MGNQQTKITTDDVPVPLIAAVSPAEQMKYVPPFRRFKSQYQKTNGKLIESLVSLQQPYQQNIEILQSIYKDLQEAYDNKTKDIQIVSAMFDEVYYDKYSYQITNNGVEKFLIMRPFDSYESHSYGNIVCELVMNKSISNLGNPKLHKIQDYYVIETGIDQQELPSTQILVFEPVATNLSQIIKYRRINKWDWTVNEFNNLVYDTIEGLHVLHENGITHNDIRPCNIYYSAQKNCYMLGSFSNSLLSQNKNANNMKFRTSKAYGAPQLEGNQSYNAFQGDIYSLGMSLLSSFYLYEPVSRKNTAPYNRQLEETYPIMKIIKGMIKSEPQQRLKVQQIRLQLKEAPKQNIMKDLIQSLKYKNRPKQEQLAKNKKVFSNAYQRLALWDEWKDNLIEAFEMEQNELNQITRAQTLKKLAFVQNCRGETISSSQYAKKASKIYRNIGYSLLEQGNLDQSIVNFKKAIDCKNYYEIQYDYDNAKNLQGLASAHTQKNQYELAKPLINEALQIIQKTKGKQSNQYVQVKISLAKLETQFQQFHESAKILQQCLDITQKKLEINEDLAKKTKAQILLQLGKNFMHESMYETQYSKQYIEKSEQCLFEALKLNQSLNTENNLQISQNLQAIGQIQFRKKSYHDAKRTFSKAIDLREHYNTKNNIIQSNSKQKAALLCHVAGCDTCLGEHKQAIQNYNNALNMYRKIYGTDHNRYSAMAIGNLGRVYLNKKQKAPAKECLQCSIDILGQLLGTEDPDYQYFKEVLDTQINSQ